MSEEIFESQDFGMVSDGTLNRSKRTPTSSGVFSVATNLYFLANQVPDLNKHSYRKTNADGSQFITLGTLQVNPKSPSGSGLKGRMRYNTFNVAPGVKEIRIDSTISGFTRTEIINAYAKVAEQVKNKNNGQLSPDAFKQALLHTPVIASGVYDNAASNLAYAQQGHTVKKAKVDADGKEVLGADGKPVMEDAVEFTEVADRMSLLLRYVFLNIGSTKPEFSPFMPEYADVKITDAAKGSDELSDQLELAEVLPTDLKAAYDFKIKQRQGYIKFLQDTKQTTRVADVEADIKQLEEAKSKLTQEEIDKAASTENKPAYTKPEPVAEMDNTVHVVRMTDTGGSDGAITGMVTVGYLKNYNSRREGVTNVRTVKQEDGTSFTTVNLGSINWDTLKPQEKLMFPESLVEEFNRNQVHRITFQYMFNQADNHKGSTLDRIYSYDFKPEHNALFGYVANLKLSTNNSGHVRFYYSERNHAVQATIRVHRITFYTIRTNSSTMLFETPSFSTSAGSPFDDEENFHSLEATGPEADDNPFSAFSPEALYDDSVKAPELRNVKSNADTKSDTDTSTNPADTNSEVQVDEAPTAEIPDGVIEI